MNLSFCLCFCFGFLLAQGANEGGKNYGDEYLAELDYVEVVEGIKEGYESDVLETEVPESPTNEKKQNKEDASDEEDNSKENVNDSDEDFTTTYLARNTFITSESSSIRYSSR